MSNRLISFGIETIYGTFITFFYYYVFMTIVKIKPFSFGFHPPTNLEQLSFVFMVILVGMALIKGIGLLSDYMNSERESPKHPSYFPAQRH